MRANGWDQSSIKFSSGVGRASGVRQILALLRVPAGMPDRRVTVIAALVLLQACSAVNLGSKPLATSLQEIAPHGDRDHFVYVVERPTDRGFETAAMQVEHVTKLPQPGEFEVILSEDGVATGRVHIRDDGKTLWLMNEDDYSRGIRLIYNPPLPYLRAPLLPGEYKNEATAAMQQLANGQNAGQVQVTQVVQVSAVGAGEWRSGTYGSGVQLQTTRTLQSPDGSVDLTTTMVLVPGIGEVRSEGKVSGAATVRRQLACAIIGGRSIGSCTDLFRKK